MYLEKVRPETISECKKAIPLFFEPTYQYLKDNGYHIYYFFEMADKTIYYVATPKDIKDCYLHACEPFLAFSVKENGKIDTDDDAGKVFLYYLYEREMSLPEEKRDSLYSEVSSISELVEGLSGKEAIKKMDARKEFLEFLKKLEKEDKAVEKSDARDEKIRGHLSLKVEDKPTQNPRLQFSLTLMTSEKNYEVKDLYKFLTGFKTREEYPLSTKKKIVLEPMSFLSPYDRVFPILNTQTHFQKKARVSSASISLEHFVPVLEVLQDELFTFDDKDIRVEDVDNVSFSLNEKGKPVFNPPYEDEEGKKYTYVGKDGIYVYLLKEKKIVRYLFPDVRLKNTYLYFLDHSRDDFSYIQDIFNDKLLPELTKSLRKSKTSGKEEKKPFEICLYLTIDEEKGLHFKTTYLENGEEVKEVQSVLGNSMKTAYLSVLTSFGGKENGSLKKDDEIVSFLHNDLSALSNLCLLYCDERLKRSNQMTPTSLRIGMKKKGDFLSLTLDSDRFTKEELENILSAYHEKKKYFLLKDRFVFLQGEELEEAGKIFSSGSTKEDDVPLYTLFSLSSGMLSLDEDESCKKVLSSLKNFSQHELKAEKKAESLLRPYQKDGVKYLLSLYDYGFGGILADEMGLGKTFETISFLSCIPEKKPILIITPKAVLYNWESEIHKFSSLECTIIDSDKETRERIILGIPKDRKTVYLMSYDTFKRDSDLFEKIEFSSVILDEAQSIKNSFSKRHQALMTLKSHNKIALSGTPLENSPMDLWSIFDFLMPGYFGTDTEFAELVESKSKRLPLLLKPFLLRRRKEDVLKDLPEKSESNVIISMNEGERMLYLSYLEKARNLSHENKISILSSITRLRQICVDPASFLEGYDTSTKLSYTVNLLKETIENGHKAIVFSSFKSALMDLKDLLDEEDIPSFVITGDTNGKDRLSYAEKFNTEDGVKVMLVSLKAGGVGLNLIGADTVIHLDPWWNPQAENQATDRAHRIGQTRPVSVLRLIMKDTVEEKVLHLQEEKKNLYDEIVENNGGVSSLSDEDISFLLL